MKPNIDRKIAWVTRNWETTFENKRSKVMVIQPAYHSLSKSYGCVSVYGIRLEEQNEIKSLNMLHMLLI